MKLENSLQANKTIQNLKFNNETKLVRENSGRTTAPSPSASLPKAPVPISPGPQGHIGWVVQSSVSWR